MDNHPLTPPIETYLATNTETQEDEDLDIKDQVLLCLKELVQLPESIESGIVAYRVIPYLLERVATVEAQLRSRTKDLLVSGEQATWRDACSEEARQSSKGAKRSHIESKSNTECRFG